MVRFDSGFTVEAAKLEDMEHRAHRYCFIPNTRADSVEARIDPAKERTRASE